MIRCAFLVTVFFASAFGLSSDDLSGDATQPRNMCFFTHPSTPCKEKCQELDAEPFCQETTGRCLCRTKSVLLPNDYKQPEPEHQDVSTLHFMGNDNIAPAQTTAQPEPDHEEQVIPMKDYCFFGEFPSLACKSKCSHRQLESFCQDDENKTICLCREKQPEDLQLPSTPAPDIADYCWFGEFPSNACREKCGENEPVCDNRHCLCSNTFGVLQPPVPATTPATTLTTGTADENAESSPVPTTESTLHHIALYLYDFGGLFDTGSKSDSETTEVEGQPTLATSTSAPTTLAHAQGHSGWSYQYLIGAAIFFLLALLVGIEVYRFVAKRRATKLQSVFSQMPDQTKPTKP